MKNACPPHHTMRSVKYGVLGASPLPDLRLWRTPFFCGAKRFPDPILALPEANLSRQQDGRRVRPCLVAAQPLRKEPGPWFRLPCAHEPTSIYDQRKGQKSCINLLGFLVGVATADAMMDFNRAGPPEIPVVFSEKCP
jgi:hypothetical protein